MHLTGALLCFPFGLRWLSPSVSLLCSCFSSKKIAPTTSVALFFFECTQTSKQLFYSLGYTPVGNLIIEQTNQKCQAFFSKKLFFCFSECIGERINNCGRFVFVVQSFLNFPKRNSLSHKINCKGFSEAVGRNSSAHAERFPRPFHIGPNSLAGSVLFGISLIWENKHGFRWIFGTKTLDFGENLLPEGYFAFFPSFGFNN